MAGKRRGYDRELIERGTRLAYRVIEDVPFCWMCDAESGERAKEHIFALSLLKALDAEDERFSPTHMSSHGGIVSERPAMPAKALVAGEVCKSCNAGWMSELEEHAQPLLLAGARHQKPRYLDCDAQLALARWFFKTAIVLNSSQNWRLLLPREVRHSARAGVHPDVRILVAQRTPKPSDQVEFYQGFTGMITSVPEDRTSAMARAGERIYAGWIGVADWYGVVIYAPPGGWPNPATDFRQLWPYQGDFDWADIPAWSNLAEELILTGDPPPGLLDDPELLAGPDLPLHFGAGRRR